MTQVVDYTSELEEQLYIAEIAVRRLNAENTRLRALLREAVNCAVDYKLYRDWVWKSEMMLEERQELKMGNEVA